MKSVVIELNPNEDIIYEEKGYTLTSEPSDDGMAIYRIYDEFGNDFDEFEDLALGEDVINNEKVFKDSYVYSQFRDCITDGGFASRWDDDDYFYDYYDLGPSKGKFSKLYEPKPLTPEEIEAKQKAERELIESLCKSDTIVFHQEDKTTVMLDPIYEGKGFDVYKGSMWRGDLSRDAIHELIERHDRIVCLGHGTPSGLLSGVIGKEEVPYLKDKKIFSMWCYAATFWKNNGFSGHGILTSDNFPSEVWECKAACDATVTADWIFDNMMLAGEIAGKAMDIAWDDPERGCKIFRKEYSEKSKIENADEQAVVDFNTNSMQVV